MKIAAACMTAVLILFVLFSVAFIAHEADHECSGEDCPVCALIIQCENNLRQIGGGSMAAAMGAACFILVLIAAKSTASAHVILSTPVLLKTRLNN